MIDNCNCFSFYFKRQKVIFVFNMKGRTELNLKLALVENNVSATWQSKAKKMLIFRFVGIFEYIFYLC